MSFTAAPKSGNGANKPAILIAEDDPYLRKLIELGLARYYTVTAVGDGLQAVDAYHREHPMLVLLDVMMPQMNGWQACQQIRECSEVPIAMLTSLANSAEITKGFALGADDYITKPFILSELLARVEAILRRTYGRLRRSAGAAPSTAPDTARRGASFWLDTESRAALVHGHLVPLTPIEYQLLYHLVARPGEVVTKDQLFQQAWGYDLAEGPALVDLAIQRLRTKLEVDAADPEFIVSDAGGGYRYAGPINTALDGALQHWSGY
ncbi:MAG TPA: response regulator transcription factor [Anaerolineae bacterium]